METLLVVDGHVHFYRNYNIDILLSSAVANFSIQIERSSFVDNLGVLLVFSTRKDEGIKQELLSKSAGKWSFAEVDASVVLARYKNDQLYIVFGEQVVSSEGIEVLVLPGASNDTYAGKPVDDIISGALRNASIVILPWGVGKWVGKRGKIITDTLLKYKDKIYIGDNSARPWFWRRIKQFKVAEENNIKLLSGTDPLPIKNQEYKVGSFGFIYRGMIGELNFTSICEVLKSHAKPVSFGRNETIFNFFINQIKLRVKQNN